MPEGGADSDSAEPAAEEPATAEPARLHALDAEERLRRKAFLGANTDRKSKADGKDTDRQPGIVIKPWDPKTPYVKELQDAKPEAVFDVYMKNREKFGDSPAFFLDCADFFAKQGNAQLALQVLSNIAELELENPSLLRVLAHRLAQTDRFDLAILTFEEVLKLRPEEPQSYRDLALVVARRAKLRPKASGIRSSSERSSSIII